MVNVTQTETHSAKTFDLILVLMKLKLLLQSS